MDYSQKIRSYIQECGLDKELSCVDAAELRLNRFKKGEYLFHANEQQNYLYILIRGRAKILSVSKEGKMAVIGYIESKDVAGDLEAALEGHHPFLHDAQVLEDSLVLSIPYQILEKHLMNHPPFLRLLCRKVGEKLELASKQYYRRALYHAQNILCRSLIMQSEEKEGIFFSFSCIDTALSIGISERHLRRILNQLIEDELIQKRGRHLCIMNMCALRNIETEI